jgi:hypothetical protein
MVPLLIRSALVVRPCLVDWVVDIPVTGLRWISLQELFLVLLDSPKGKRRRRGQVSVQCWVSETIFLEGRILAIAEGVGVGV